jgi:hypothetical protein
MRMRRFIMEKKRINQIKHNTSSSLLLNNPIMHPPTHTIRGKNPEDSAITYKEDLHTSKSPILRILSKEADDALMTGR